MKCPTHAVVHVDLKGLNDELKELLEDGYFDDDDPREYMDSVEDAVHDWVGSNIGRFIDAVFADV